MTGILLLTTIISGIVLTSSSTHADSTATSNASVTVDTACTLSASGGGTYSATITPGTHSEITGSTLSTVCNDPNGYSIYAIGYGNDSYDTPTNTQMIGANGIGNIVTGTATSGNTSNWAMKVNPTTGTAPTIMNNYNTYQNIPADYTQIAKYTASTTSPSSTGASIDTKYQVYITSAQIAGTYTGKVKYTMVHPNDAPAPENPKPYIKDFTNAMCQSQASSGNVTVVDERDNNEYTVRYINGACWMTQNLRYLGDTGSAAKTMTIGNNNSNVSNKSIALYSLDSSNAGNFDPYSGRCDSTNGYNNACVYDSGSETTGVWYNYYAASGGTISTNNNKTAATNDICPFGWHLPSGPNTTSGTDYNKLIGNTTSGWQNPTAGLTSFGAVAGGYYYGGSLTNTGRGYWWSATALDTTNRYLLRYNSSNGQFYGNINYYRYHGVFVRCVRSS